MFFQARRRFATFALFFVLRVLQAQTTTGTIAGTVVDPTGSRMAGAAVTFREIADLSHTFPRDETGAILDWFLSGPRPPSA